MVKNKLTTSVLAGAMILVGMVGGTALMASAQTPATSSISTSATNANTVDTPESANDPIDTAVGARAHGHAPLGGDGIVSSINGTTIVMTEEADEGSVSYSVDASKASVMNNGAAGSLADLTVGAKIFVQGTTSGTNVTATSISLGHPGERADKANDTDGGTTSEASEPTGSSTTSDQ